MSSIKEAKLALKEQQLLQQLQELSLLCEDVSNRFISCQKELKEKDQELNTIRREMISLKEENQTQREVLQTWKLRLETILCKFPDQAEKE